MTDAVDVVVVGGRIGGCLTALRLASRGVSVRLLESHGMPSDTLSTHFFRGDGLVRSLQEVGVLDEVLSTGAPPLGCEYFSMDGGPLEQGAPQDPGSIGYCLSVRRSTLDAILARRAAAAGVDVRLHVRVADVISRDGNVAGVVDRSGERHPAQVVVGADGRRSTVARLVGAGDEERHAPARAMYYRYATGWRSPGPVGAEFLLDGRNFCYALPSDGGVACLAVSVPVDVHELAKGDAAGVLERTLGANPQTADRMADIEWASGAFTGLPADSVWRTACGPGWALVGDAGTAQDPFAGLGMDTAARQAEAFVEAFLTDAWEIAYAQLRHDRTYAGFAETTRLAPDLRQLVGG
jgi:2-polyprenyl-6-methoxyphenol hydroxylase-like FAD-dependent oxidoreductase